MIKEVDELSSWTAETGNGIFNFPFYDRVPPECMAFIQEQFARFNVPLHEELLELADAAGYVPFCVVDGFAPYLIFSGISDVDITDDWCRHAYEMIEYEGATPQELDAERLETYIYIPGQAERVFMDCLSRPGLDALPYDAGDILREASGKYNDDWISDVWSRLSEECKQACFRHMPAPPGSEFSLCETTFTGYTELAMWAAFLWLIGPPGRSLRAGTCEIFDAAMASGECLLAEGCVIDAIHYRKLQRAPKSCHRCGLDAWCVELTSSGPSMVGQSARHICEHCLTEGMPVYRPANCGGKMCRWLTCPYHPDHGTQRAGMHGWYGQHGQLAGGSLRVNSMVRRASLDGTRQPTMKQLEGPR
jgi:hypothetical protein